MLRKFKPFLSPSSFIFQDPDTGRKLVAVDRKSLVRHIVAYRAQNQLPIIERLDLVLENYLCEQPMNRHACQEISDKDSRGLLYYVKGGIKLIRQMLYKSYAQQEEADRRSAICVTCKYNKADPSPAYPKWLAEVVTKSIGSRRSLHHDKLYTCSVCDCPLAAKVWYGAKDLEIPHDQLTKMREVGCWQPELIHIKSKLFPVKPPNNPLP